jgi:ribosomal protein S27E
MQPQNEKAMTPRNTEPQLVEVGLGENLARSLDATASRPTGLFASQNGDQDEVGGRATMKLLKCPHCGSTQYVWIDYEGEIFTCDSCGLQISAAV